MTDSPDLGPPPVAHFDEGDPIKFDPKPERSISRTSSESTEGSQPTLPANLETRKKRRESSHHRDIGEQKSTAKSSQEATSRDPDVATGQPLKSGAKRKLNVRDEEDQPVRSDDQEKETFQFNRKIADSRMNESTAAKPNISRTSKPARDKVSQVATGGSQVRKDRAAETPAIATTNNRKALGPSKSNPIVVDHEYHLTSLQKV